MKKQRQLVIRIEVEDNGAVEPFMDANLDWSEPGILGRVAALHISAQSSLALLSQQGRDDPRYMEEYKKAMTFFCNVGGTVIQGSQAEAN